MTSGGMMMRESRWHDLWLLITGRQRRTEPEAAVEVALRDSDLAFGGLTGPINCGLEAERREGRPLRRRRLREPAGF
ncbi:hypothetical protein ELI30_05110 [Rhizobium leguminosarum]|uniref:hypothetical protein n=1 Tax=Rhizobium leguminosarum TaxID=384 RepID=UPI001031A50D|nr:hypothetical protein [Rhizobium leguminosarum]TAU82740.1 hypothetical protein ELI40_05320 [Rhizobium leguminosarum]TAV47644.1 hypothetical protein ELI32_05110 [Rhizobium leguminosarum]TAV57224.1 hypothetical protein ELI31_05110 [Rhizobium leguminosarum]TAV68163.1 hypothetical protein ELI30_05110 [Rhizobium leguminosarum]TAX08922.1 hypothetical protein ELI07_05145 [Rhizobium leguminosarum]